MPNMVPVQGVLTALMKRESAPIRQGLWAQGIEISDRDEVDLDKVDQKKLAEFLKKGSA